MKNSESNGFYRESPIRAGVIIEFHLSSGEERSLKHAVPDLDGIIGNRHSCACWVARSERIKDTRVGRRAPEDDSRAGLMVSGSLAKWQSWRSAQSRRRGKGTCASTYCGGNRNSRIDHDRPQVGACSESVSC